ncbi:MAG: hypothetical protein ACYSWO_26845 [Planctomycetota bacterium]|jgi:hypothetical protein
MDMKENTEPERIEKTRPRGKWKDSHVVMFVLPVVLTILFPVGGIYYLCGRFSPVGLDFATICMMHPVVVVFMCWCLFTGIVKLLGLRGKRTRGEKLLIIAETAVPLIFAGLFFLPFSLSVERRVTRGPGPGLIAVGLRHRVESEVDIAATRVWLQSLDDEDYGRIYTAELPKSLGGLRHAGARVSQDGHGRPMIWWGWGGTPSGHWGIVIGMEDMEAPPYESGPEIRTVVPVEPGVYVWWGE